MKSELPNEMMPQRILFTHQELAGSLGLSDNKPGTKSFVATSFGGVCWVFLFLLFLCSCQQSVKTSYSPKHANQWAKIDTHIRQNWQTTWKTSPDLPEPFVSIGPDINYLYYWDCYFFVEGLLRHNQDTMAQSTVNNLLWLADTLGFVPNALQDWGMNRTQIAFLSPMVRAIYDHQKTKDKVWLGNAYRILKKEYDFWTNSNGNFIEDHRSPIEGLSRFSHHANETIQSEMFKVWAGRTKADTTISDPEKLRLGSHATAECECCDFTPRFENRIMDFIPIDLNANLYLYEKNFAYFATELNLNGEPDWDSMALRRKELINKYLWDSKRGLYLDYDFVNRRFAEIPCAAQFLALWTDIASAEQARRLVNQLPLWEYAAGISYLPDTRRDSHYQWDYPVLWPPVQFMVYRGLKNYGFDEDAKRIAEKYLDVVTGNFLEPKSGDEKLDKLRKPGILYEKYHTETGNVNDTEYQSMIFLGWTAGVFACFYNDLNGK